MMARSNKSDPSREYRQSDIEELSDRSRRVLLSIGVQSGTVDPSGDIDVPSGVRERDVVTTTTVREALDLNNDQINYELRKLGGDRDFSVDVPLIDTHHRGTDASGQQKPKRIDLTSAGRQALTDGVVNVQVLDLPPSWYPDDGTTDEQLRAIARRLDAHESVLDELAGRFGLQSPTAALTDASDESQQALDLQPNIKLAKLNSDAVVLETLDGVVRANQAIQRALKQAGIDPSEFLD